MEMSASDKRMARLMLDLRQAGIIDGGVLDAIESVDRADFVDAAYKDFAYEHAVIPIGAGQTLGRPIEIARLLQAAAMPADRSARVLLVGLGSGYLAALLAKFSDHVFGVERFNRLVEPTTDRLAGLGIESITMRVGDGLEGWREKGPFDRIILAGAVPKPPEELLDQLTKDGILVCPMTRPEEDVIVSVSASGEKQEANSGSRYQRLVAGEAEAL